MVYKNWREIVGAVNLELMPLDASMIFVAASFDMPRLAVKSRSLYEIIVVRAVSTIASAHVVANATAHLSHTAFGFALPPPAAFASSATRCWCCSSSDGPRLWRKRSICLRILSSASGFAAGTIDSFTPAPPWLAAARRLADDADAAVGAFSSRT